MMSYGPRLATSRNPYSSAQHVRAAAHRCGAAFSGDFLALPQGPFVISAVRQAHDKDQDAALPLAQAA
jgi:hypothetical protein